MKIVWTIVALLLLGGLIVLFQPSGDARPDALSAPRAPETPDAPPPVATTPPPATPAVTPAVTATPTPTSTIPAPGLATNPSKTVSTADAKPSVKKQPTAEPPKPAAEAIAAGSEFTPEIAPVANAELLPSKFIKLADGSISVDDAWTIRGEGTEAAPYEVSWEFLSSAQEEYMPRLGEKKLPARIAFLSGKRVRIAGYLAFPLVAPTASECLLMLNQWDGCCIGVPPTPYDAVEVKLSAELKGWKRHTINFGSVEGTFKVEPYLVENWLVGLYLFENATLDSEL